MAATCPHCACTCIDGALAHALLVLLAADDLDAALEHGLLEAPRCSRCNAACNAMLSSAQGACNIALAARGRHRARDVRLRRRKAEREAARVPKPTAKNAPALPAGAADVLARALDKARTRK